MSEVSSSDWSETDNSNTAATPNGWPEGQTPGSINNCARAMMGALKRFWGRIQGEYASTGSSNAYVLTPSVALGAYVTGERYSFRANFANTGSATLNISSLGAKTIKKLGRTGAAALVGGEIQDGQPVTVEYDGTDLLMVTPVAAGSRGALVYRSTTQSIPDTTTTALQFDNEDRDTDTIHDNSTNNSRLTVPTGVTKIKLRGQVDFGSSATGFRFVAANKNGSGGFAGRPISSVAAAGATAVPRLNISSPILTVVAGDYFELVVAQTSGGALLIGNVSGETWFEMEIVE